MLMMHTVTHLDAGQVTPANIKILYLCFCLLSRQETYLWPAFMLRRNMHTSSGKGNIITS